MKSLRSVIYVFGGLAIAATLYAAGLFPAGLSASEQLAVTLQESFGCRSRVNDQGEVVQLSIGNPKFQDADCRQLATLQSLESVDLSGTGITDEGLAALAKLPALTTLKLSATGVTDDGLATLAECTSLKELSLARCPIEKLTAAGAGTLTSLQSLNLMDTSLTDDSGEALATLVNLEQLYIGRTRISSGILAALTDLQKLKLLNVAGILVTSDADMQAFGALAGLEMIYLDRAELNDAAFTQLVNALRENENCAVAAIFLEGCRISDESRDSLLELVRLPTLGKLRLTDTQVSRDVFNELVKAAPEISFAHGISEAD